MVGQNTNKGLIDEFIINNSMPRFIIISGVEGSGKRTFAKYIADKLKADFLLFDNKIDSVREVINLAYSQTNPIVYCIYGYETMSIAARNSLLKVAEEPPTNTYVILTATNKNEILPTLLSRGVSLTMEDYSRSELEECAELLKIKNPNIDLCEVPNDLIKLLDINEKEFTDFIDNVWDKLGNASIGNALKLTNKIKIKDEQTGYDVNLFINSIMRKVEKVALPPRHGRLETSKNNINVAIKILKLCYETKNKFNSKYSKQALIDNFIIELKGLRDELI